MSLEEYLNLDKAAPKQPLDEFLGLVPKDVQQAKQNDQQAKQNDQQPAQDIQQPAQDDQIAMEAAQKRDIGMLEAIATGAAKGFTEFANGMAKLSNLLPSNPLNAISKHYNMPDKVDKHVLPYLRKHAEETSKQRPYSTLAGDILGSTVATAPIGGIAGAATKGIGALSRMMPYGAKLATKYGAAAATGSGLAGLYGGLQSKEGEAFNTEQAVANASNPLSAGMGMLFHGVLPTYGDRAMQFVKDKGAAYGAKIFSADSAGHGHLLNATLGRIPIFGTSAQRFKQGQSFIPAIEKFVKETSGEIALKNKGENAAVAVKHALKRASVRLSKQEKDLWAPINAVEKSIKIGADKVGTLSEQAKYILKNHKLSRELSDDLNKLAPGGEITFAQIREIKRHLQNALFGKKSISDNTVFSDVNALYRELYSSLDDSLASSGYKHLIPKYHEANTFTSQKYKALEAGGKDLEKALYDQSNAAQFAKTLMKEETTDVMKRKTAFFNTKDKQIIRAGVIGQKLEDAVDPASGYLNVNKFIQGTESGGQKQLMGKTYHALSGLLKHMKLNSSADPTMRSVESGPVKAGLARQALMGGAMVGGGIISPQLTATVLLTTKAMSAIAAKSPVKSLLYQVSKLPVGSRALKYFMPKIQRALELGGYRMITEEDKIIIDHEEMK